MAAPSSLDPRNVTALLAHRGRGNPVAAHVSSAISNCFPGLEYDFRAVWKRVFVGIELHEAENVVVAVEAAGAAAGVRLNDELQSVDGKSVVARVSGPPPAGGPDEDLGETNLEWGNALATVVQRAGQSVACVFRRANGAVITANLTVRQLFDGITIHPDAAAPGVLTQGLCSPWQNDYRECGCYYWASSRPDFVNVEVDAAGQAVGHNWTHKNRTAATQKVYQPDGSGVPGQVTYEDLFRAWESELRFIVRGQDSGE
jgi:hypothetical protein